jgi:serine/threonine protein kinase
MFRNDPLPSITLWLSSYATRYHHDIKPSNILLSGGQFKLSDFGFASAGPVVEAMISPPAAFGTVSYGQSFFPRTLNYQKKRF